MQGSFLEYAYSVIYSRALPDARDGLKPVQRRILYQMSEMGLRPDRGPREERPRRRRGDGQAAPARRHRHLRRDGAPWRSRSRCGCRSIDGHGNFGSLDDGPAAPRYTEARLAERRARDDAQPRRGRRRLRPQLRQPAHAARGAPRGVPEPARQRRERHRGRHGDEHGPAQPRRGRRAPPATSSTTPTPRSTT